MTTIHLVKRISPSHRWKLLRFNVLCRAFQEEKIPEEDLEELFGEVIRLYLELIEAKDRLPYSRWRILRALNRGDYRTAHRLWWSMVVKIKEEQGNGS